MTKPRKCLPSARSNVSSLICLLALATTGCGVLDVSEGVSPGTELCNPTGRSFIRTGVYIGPDGCEEATLYPTRTDATTGENTKWSLWVGFPTYGEHPAVQLHNLTTQDGELEIIYVGDPEFPLVAGNNVNGGLVVAPGINTIKYELWEVENDERVTLEEGTFELDVTLSETRPFAD